ncbi:hypothetical protein LJC48_06830, partial [Desulfovibrio sp. OttesenSCG-928-C06]|nr:hypothetical protein [Desulfovibrio sp. OttesenSCG-928-C06]
MLIIEYANKGTEFFEPAFFPQGTSVQKVKKDFDVSTGGDSTILQQFDAGHALIINGNEYDIENFDSSQISVSRYSIFGGNTGEDGYFYTHDSDSFTTSFTWDGIGEDDFDASRVKVYVHEVVFMPSDGDEWSELYLDKITYDDAEC